MGLMGRMAAYTGQEITWDQAMNSEESIVPAKLGWDMRLSIPPMAMPGQTRLI
jgi:myo-inositol 2-dehydrogenase/D-chiro-inositol 1-dehydrogenase